MGDLPSSNGQKKGKQPQKRNATSFKPGQIANPAGARKEPATSSQKTSSLPFTQTSRRTVSKQLR